MSESRERLHAELLGFVRDPDPARFDALALRVIAYQAEALAPYGRMVAARGGVPDRWRDAPLVPTALFRDVDLCSQPHSVVVFRTSGTTGSGARGYRRVSDLSLYDAAMRAPFVAAVLGGDPTPRRWLSLIPHREVLADSSLSHMVSKLAETLASDATWAFGATGLNLEAARDALAAARGPIVVLTTAFALVHLLDGLGAQRLTLPAGSRLMLTGGFKGKSRQLDQAALRNHITDRLGIVPSLVIDEYGMTELSSQAYGRPLVANPSLRLRVIDPATQRDVETGETGLVAAFDLLNLDNVSAIVTGDLGRLDEGGRLTLLGRAPTAVLRGCSLSAEDLGVLR